MAIHGARETVHRVGAWRGYRLNRPATRRLTKLRRFPFGE
jgi:hypothetical protein